MGAEVLVELYRFNEDVENKTYTASVTLVYEGDVVNVKALDRPLTNEDVRELDAHVGSRGVRLMRYMRKGRQKQRRVKFDSQPIGTCRRLRGEPNDSRQQSPTGDAIQDKGR